MWPRRSLPLRGPGYGRGFAPPCAPAHEAACGYTLIASGTGIGAGQGRAYQIGSTQFAAAALCFLRPSCKYVPIMLKTARTTKRLSIRAETTKTEPVE